jgi:hypothetical protein
MDILLAIVHPVGDMDMMLVTVHQEGSMGVFINPSLVAGEKNIRLVKRIDELQLLYM